LTAAKRLNVRISGAGNRTIMFAHGFGCDQMMWRHVSSRFEGDFRVVLFDYVGAGGSDASTYNPQKYATLQGYAEDVVDIATELSLNDVVFVGHSVSAMIGVLAAAKAPGIFGKMVMVGPSPRYVDDGDYRGGFTAAQIDELLEFLGANHQGWSRQMAPLIMGNGDRPELGEELTESFCRTDPDIAKDFARATFHADNRRDLASLTVPTLILQCSDDIIAPLEVGEYLRDHIPGSRLVVLNATGHCPNLSAPDEVTEAIRSFV
jgi:sigma-B regulation protein RsbQ